MLSKHWLAGLALCAAILPSAGRAAVTEDTFQLRTTSDLVELCSAAPSDPMMTAAVNFCHGFALGVFRVLDEENAAHRINKLFCIPNPTPSRNPGPRGLRAMGEIDAGHAGPASRRRTVRLPGQDIPLPARQVNQKESDR